MRRLVVFLAMALPCSTVLYAGESDVFYEQAKAALKKSQAAPDEIVVAARLFMKAAAAFEAEGNMALTQEAHSFLYWCKKKMTLKDAENLNKGGETDVLAVLETVEQKTVDPNDAENWFKRAEAFAAKYPDEHLLIAVRFFEVADRFKGTELSLKAQDLSLKAQQAAVVPTPKAPVRLTKPVFPQGRQPVPDAAKVSALQRTIRDVFKADYSSSATQDARVALSRKLLQQSATEADIATRYALLREVLDLAVRNNDAQVAMQACEALETSFECDGVEEASQVFTRMASANLTPQQATALAEQAMQLGTRAQSRDQFEKLSGLANIVTRAAPRSTNKDLIERARLWSLQANEASREFAALKKHIATLEKTPEDEEANLAFGRFYVFHYGDLARGLPALARGSDKALKAIADQELAEPTEPLAQAGLGSAWREWGANKPEPLKGRSIERAIIWIKKALPNANGLDRAKLEKDLRELLLARPIHGIPPTILLALGLGDNVVLKQLPAIGNKERSGKFEDKPMAAMVLIGADLTTGKDFAATVVKSIQPVYLSVDGIVRGNTLGQTHSNSTKVMAKPGYGIGAVTCRSGSRMDRIRFTFMRITAKGLDPRDSYESDWIGGEGGSRDIKSSAEGRIVFGIHGHAGDNLDAIGLLVRE